MNRNNFWIRAAEAGKQCKQILAFGDLVALREFREL